MQKNISRTLSILAELANGKQLELPEGILAMGLNGRIGFAKDGKIAEADVISLEELNRLLTIYHIGCSIAEWLNDNDLTPEGANKIFDLERTVVMRAFQVAEDYYDGKVIANKRKISKLAFLITRALKRQDLMTRKMIARAIEYDRELGKPFDRFTPEGFHRKRAQKIALKTNAL